MSELRVGSRVRAVVRITNGYGAQARVIQPGSEGTLREFSRAKSYPVVEWDAGWADICRPGQVQVIGVGESGPGQNAHGSPVPGSTL